MDEYIRNYDFGDVDTYVIRNVGEFNARFKLLSQNFKIFHLNIRSISENLDQLILHLKQYTTQFDILVLTETFKIYDLNIFSLPGYNMVYNNGDVNKNDGVVVYVRENIRFGHRVIPLGEIKLLQLDFIVGGKRIILSAVYRLHPTSPHTFNYSLYNYLKSIKNDVDYSVFVGDININILNQRDYTQDYLNILNEEGYIYHKLINSLE